MKIIFLDIDGVLINRASIQRGFGKVDHECVNQLNRIIQETGAKLVMSSCWRIGHPVDELAKRCELWGIKGELIDKTPVDWRAERGDEIEEWIDDYELVNGQLESFVILDDDKDMGDLLPYLVKSTFTWGLTKELADKAIYMLNNPKSRVLTLEATEANVENSVSY